MQTGVMISTYGYMGFENALISLKHDIWQKVFHSGNFRSLDIYGGDEHKFDHRWEIQSTVEDILFSYPEEE